MNKQLANRITERVLSEAMPKTTGPGWKDGLPINMKVYQDAVAKMTPDEKKAFDVKLKAKSKQVKKDHIKAEQDFWNTYKHDILFAGSIAALLIPIPGVNYGVSLFLSSLASAGNAALYWQEGNRKQAVEEAIWAMLPLIGPIARTAPVIARLTSKGMRILFRKVIQARAGIKVAFTKAEQAVLKVLPSLNKPIIEVFKKFGEKMLKKKAAQKVIRKTKRAAVRVPFAAGNVVAGAGAYEAGTWSADKLHQAMGWDDLDQMDQTGTSKIFSNKPY